ncbi:GNAT family N-acetyltransferase [Desulfohalobium retbaense]|uniref:BioF2-like acetyltransferase domain-containing protein n=1 Tax=Desulfohalobium retbaense (strain ATCC 49708 / DSM 5692 / JCM 16813 / HR100) TaxID=485915 RepID=C8WZG0_DESRD|nr:GNAT family N-acetyltransferase [Desulfohalobium retbaense]ACV67435.1 protein of unknown function DUF482 [Desulfohalobium retbaense DSM 5692]
MTAPSTLSLQWHKSMASIPREEWNRLSTPLQNPLLSWDWLHLLETSGAVRTRTGWTPSHVTLWRERRLVAAAPLYLRHNSWGDYIFDQVWAEVAERIGLGYYPKLVGACPFSPVPGYRFLLDPAENEQHLTTRILRSIHTMAVKRGISGCHFHFVDPEWKPLLEHCDYLAWVQPGFLWHNDAFKSFEDFLSRFHRNQRRNIRRELRKPAELGIETRIVPADQAPEQFFTRMYAMYRKTARQFGRWGCHFLTPQFFLELSQNKELCRNLLFTAGFERHGSGKPIALSLLIRKGNTLLGRYWGCLKDYDALHFNLCYYLPIQWAIDHGIAFFDPGMGGEHKSRRGFCAVANHSLHRFFPRPLMALFRQHIEAINRHQREGIATLNATAPYVFANSQRQWPVEEKN